MHFRKHTYNKVKLIAKFKAFLLLTGMLLFSACSNTRYLPQGEKLFTDLNVKFEKHTNSKVKASTLEEMVRPQPNSKILGMRIKLYAYNIAKEPKGKGLNYFLKKKFGEPPVLFRSVNIKRNIDVLTNYLENQGYFNATVSADTVDKRKRVSLTFTVNAGARYKINEIVFPADSDSLNTYIRETAKETLLKKGDPFIFEIIKEVAR